MSQKQGSPPRMWGRAAPFPVHTSIPRITPARAGKRLSLWSTRSRTRDHPRACGEELRRVRYLPGAWGSPPRVRGRVLAAVLLGGLGGITPARAGKSHPKKNSGNLYQDHPRACGEESRLDCAIASSRGSPPRVRGRGREQHLGFVEIGITPARAGKSSAISWEVYSLVHHPRACGEELGGGIMAKAKKGSPPRVRGREFPDEVLSAPSGITPARAGKRQPRPGDTPPRGDHPRACGEESKAPETVVWSLGSPPRVRGRAIPTSLICVGSRITPARAGKRM